MDSRISEVTSEKARDITELGKWRNKEPVSCEGKGGFSRKFHRMRSDNLFKGACICGIR